MKNETKVMCDDVVLYVIVPLTMMLRMKELRGASHRWLSKLRRHRWLSRLRQPELLSRE